MHSAFETRFELREHDEVDRPIKSSASKSFCLGTTMQDRGRHTVVRGYLIVVWLQRQRACCELPAQCHS